MQYIISRRFIITESHEPWFMDKFGNPVREKVYHIILVEQQLPYLRNNSSQLSLNSWKDHFSHFFPSKGILFKYSSILAPIDDQVKSTLFSHVIGDLTHDLINIEGSMPISTVLVTRGPIMSLAAQYFLESWPLKGLVMIDPLLLPPPFLSETASILLNRIPKDLYAQSTIEWEVQMLQQLRDGLYDRKLKIEPGSVPMCILSSSVTKTLSSDESPLSKVFYTSTQTASRHSLEIGCTVSLREIRDDVSWLPENASFQKNTSEMLEAIYSFCENNV